MATDFHYVPLAPEPLSGPSFIEQTELAVNELGEQLDAVTGDVGEALDLARQALTTANAALETAQDALAVANEAATAADAAQAAANQAQDTAAESKTTADSALIAAQAAQSAAELARTTAAHAQAAAETAQTTADNAVDIAADALAVANRPYAVANDLGEVDTVEIILTTASDLIVRPDGDLTVDIAVLDLTVSRITTLAILPGAACAIEWVYAGELVWTDATELRSLGADELAIVDIRHVAGMVLIHVSYAGERVKEPEVIACGTFACGDGSQCGQVEAVA